MCRLGYVPSNSGLEQGEVEQLVAFLDRGGGHGWGVVWLDVNRGLNGVRKADMTRQEAATLVWEHREEPVLFHTRLPTVGPAVDELTQPFVVGGSAYAHNGHWGGFGQYKDVAMLLLGISSGEVPLYLSDSLVAVALMNLNQANVRITSGTWLRLDQDGSAWARPGSFGFCQFKTEAGKIIYASDFPWAHERINVTPEEWVALPEEGFGAGEVTTAGLGFRAQVSSCVSSLVPKKPTEKKPERQGNGRDQAVPLRMGPDGRWSADQRHLEQGKLQLVGNSTDDVLYLPPPRSRLGLDTLDEPDLSAFLLDAEWLTQNVQSFADAHAFDLEILRPVGSLTLKDCLLRETSWRYPFWVHARQGFPYVVLHDQGQHWGLAVDYFPGALEKAYWWFGVEGLAHLACLENQPSAYPWISQTKDDTPLGLVIGVGGEEQGIVVHLGQHVQLARFAARVRSFVSTMYLSERVRLLGGTTAVISGSGQAFPTHVFREISWEHPAWTDEEGETWVINSQNWLFAANFDGGRLYTSSEAGAELVTQATWAYPKTNKIGSSVPVWAPEKTEEGS